MRHELLNQIASHMADHTMENLIPLIDENCVYLSAGKLPVSGRSDICELLSKIDHSMLSSGTKTYTFPVIITSSESKGIEPNLECIAVCQKYPWNCIGFMCCEFAQDKRITKFDYCIDPSVHFRPLENNCCFDCVPCEAHDAIKAAAEYHGILTKHDDISAYRSHFKNINIMSQRLYSYIIQELHESFINGICNVGGYIFCASAADALSEKSWPLTFPFRESDSVLDSPPFLASGTEYTNLFNKGFNIGKEIIYGFVQYVILRAPDDESFSGNLLRTLRDIALLGVIWGGNMNKRETGFDDPR